MIAQVERIIYIRLLRVFAWCCGRGCPSSPWDRWSGWRCRRW